MTGYPGESIHESQRLPFDLHAKSSGKFEIDQPPVVVSAQEAQAELDRRRDCNAMITSIKESQRKPTVTTLAMVSGVPNLPGVTSYLDTLAENPPQSAADTLRHFQRQDRQTAIQRLPLSKILSVLQADVERVERDARLMVDTGEITPVTDITALQQRGIIPGEPGRQHPTAAVQ